MEKSILVENCELLTHEGFQDIHSIFIANGLITRISSETTQDVPAATTRIDGGGATVLPGLIDTHCHLVQLGEVARTVDLKGTTNVTSIRLRVFARVRKSAKGEWIIGGGWDQESISERRFLRRADVDDLTPNNPILLVRICGHIGLLNTAALNLLGIRDDTPDPIGGVYERNEQGRLTGILKETALSAVLQSLPPSDISTIRDDILRGEYEAAKFGLTTLHCFLSANYADELKAFQELRESGGLALRYRLFVPVEGLQYVEERNFRDVFNDNMLRLSGIKLFTDGSLGARTAALTEPYADEPSSSGLLRYSDAEILARFEGVVDQGYQIAAHAIGDRAIRQCVDAFKSLAKPNRHRVEHASLADGELIADLAEVRVGVAVQPHFVVSEPWVKDRLGQNRLDDLYRFKSMLEAGLKVSGSSDAPVEPISPVLGIWAAVTRDSQAQNERLNLLEALKLYTLNAAYNSGDEDTLGSVREGGPGDVTLLDSNVRDMHPQMIRKVGIAATIVGGEIAFSYEGYV